MLSPKARNLVRPIRGATTVTVTSKVHAVDCPAASRAVHCTLVVPPLNNVPDCRVHDTSTGGEPPLMAGAANVIRSDGFDVVTLMFEGQTTDSNGGVDGGAVLTGGVVVGAVGDEHPTINDTASAMVVKRRRATWGSG